MKNEVIINMNAKTIRELQILIMKKAELINPTGKCYSLFIIFDLPIGRGLIMTVPCSNE